MEQTKRLLECIFKALKHFSEGALIEYQQTVGNRQFEHTPRQAAAACGIATLQHVRHITHPSGEMQCVQSCLGSTSAILKPVRLRRLVRRWSKALWGRWGGKPRPLTIRQTQPMTRMCPGRGHRAKPYSSSPKQATSCRRDAGRSRPRTGRCAASTSLRCSLTAGPA